MFTCIYNVLYIYLLVYIIACIYYCQIFTRFVGEDFTPVQVYNSIILPVQVKMGHEMADSALPLAHTSNLKLSIGPRPIAHKYMM